MPTRHGGSCTNQDRNFDRRSARRTTTVPCSSTACTWKTPFARSTPTVLIFFMDGSRVLVSAIQLRHIDAVRGPSTPSLRHRFPGNADDMALQREAFGFAFGFAQRR